MQPALHVVPRRNRTFVVPIALLTSTAGETVKSKFKLIQALLSVTMASVLLAPLSAAADTLDDIKAKGRMVVAIDPTFAPYEFTDGSGKIVGYTPEIMQTVAKRLGVTLEYQTMAFNGIIPGLLARSFDLEGSSLNVTAERAKRVRFTVPFGKSVNAVMTRADDGRVASPASVEALAGLTAIVKATTAPEKLLKDFNAALAAKKLAPIKILSLDTVEQTLSALQARRGDFVFDDITVLGAAMTQNPGKFRAAGEVGPAQWMAWATRNDDARLNKFIGDVILDLQKSGELAALQKKHLGVTFVVPAADFVPKE
jgi:polar amino acid transport system substrate-binding protein